MIAFVEGVVAYAELDHVVINVNGVGYRVFVTGTTAFQMKEGETLRLFTHHHVREDAHLLYGFRTKEEKELFNRLINVNGIGPKVALSILGAGTPDQFVFAVRSEDVNFLTKLPGIGKKTAQRLILDLKEKLDDLATLLPVPPLSSGKGAVKAAPASKGLGAELHEALTSLGYTEKEAHEVVRSLAEEITEGVPLESLIKLALKQMMRQ
ncbi:Holliday junction DNA helicase subunit RuvA [Tumebacillus sp. BK434]|uniref:Holliday junction branch migration protein RuvA n=1 Tax=Tumebacillus sp. BK434 TaxID=2512169 RepID=UPI00104E5B16|nr:Holliday junction branch migration protein RuvA [Tumebacillus sp. BK434]TCP54402.1 Holliday junction DNA helicase subunit RuvA [Tumebacillus sp. BK434]